MTEREDIVLSADQADARLRVLQWWHAGDSPVLTMGGYAGTGKTTLIDSIIEEIGRTRVAVCAYTGKAAHVLRGKGIKTAKTIHSTIFTPQLRCKACDTVVYSECTATKWCAKAGTKTVWQRVPAIDADLIVVDEASMVGPELDATLQSFGIPILYVGDHGQLEPIDGPSGLMRDPDIRLEQIHRQAEGSAILQFAHHVRRHGEPCTMGPEATVIVSSSVPRDAHTYDIVLCGVNRTRIAVNAMIRRARGFAGTLPQAGERVVCLRNNKEHTIFNGMLATVLDVRAGEDDAHPEIDILDDDEKVRTGIRFVPEQFGNEKKLDRASSKKALFDFGYALTCHKSQGSEWPRVLVVEQQPHPDTSMSRWRYTAATRASAELVWCVRPLHERY